MTQVIKCIQAILAFERIPISAPDFLTQTKRLVQGMPFLEDVLDQILPGLDAINQIEVKAWVETTFSDIIDYILDTEDENILRERDEYGQLPIMLAMGITTAPFFFAKEQLPEIESRLSSASVQLTCKLLNSGKPLGISNALRKKLAQPIVHAAVFNSVKIPKSDFRKIAHLINAEQLSILDFKSRYLHSAAIEFEFFYKDKEIYLNCARLIASGVQAEYFPESINKKIFNKIAYYAMYDTAFGSEERFAYGQATSILSKNYPDFRIQCREPYYQTRDLSYLLESDISLTAFADFDLNILRNVWLTKHSADMHLTKLLTAKLILAGRSPQELGLSYNDNDPEFQFIATSNEPEAVAAKHKLAQEFGFCKPKQYIRHLRINSI